jgi:hypothetical protein
MAISRNIFQTVADRAALSQDYADSVARLKTLNPDWSYACYDDAEVKAYIRTHVSPADWEAIECLNPRYNVVLADLFRYLVIYNEGGVYLDIKSTAEEPLSKVLRPEYTFVISQWQNRVGEQYQGAGLHAETMDVPGGEFQQWFLIAEAGHPFLKAALERALRNIRTYTPKRFGTSKQGVLRVSGPINYTLAIWPLLGLCPWQAVDVTRLGFRYTIYEDSEDRERHSRIPDHYSTIREPIVLKDVYVDSAPIETLSLADQLAEIIRGNIDLVLKMALISFVASATFVVLLPLLVWLLR